MNLEDMPNCSLKARVWLGSTLNFDQRGTKENSKTKFLILPTVKNLKPFKSQKKL
jgi:hypothetical protein